MEIPFKWLLVWQWCSAPFRTTYRANVCGHLTHKEGLMSNGVQTVIMVMPLTTNGRPDYCLKCIGDMSIRCARCGEPIIIGSPITLDMPDDDSAIPDCAVVHMVGKERLLVGCSHDGCAEDDACGYWVPPGVVSVKPLPVGTYPQMMALRETPPVVIDYDTRDNPDPLPLHLRS